MTKNPTKAELKAEISKILKDANLEETAAKKVRLQLEQNLKCDLSNRKKEVDDLVMDYVNSQASDSDEDDDDEDDEDEDYTGNGKGKNNRKAEENSDYEEEEDEEDLSEEENPRARKSGGKRGTPAKRGPAKKKKRTSNSDDESDDDDEEQGSDDDYKPQAVAKGGKGGKKKRNNSDSDSGSRKRSKPAAKPKQAGGAKKSSGYTRPYTLSADLAAICGAESLPRHEVVKKIWAIIKERNLYDPKNRQFAICDADLQKVIGVKRFRTFGMLKYLKPHFKD
ncbi:mitotic apparatus protein p62 [Anopheles marshallii]|uniref:mitotic apparatus protein p62 n=1 Tax=Anopheles marshallii TaxID=1521116 RepID=UPI00237B2F8E|nr:mitotic apparatus protein p62 [Anopheles marshallii]